MRHTTMKHVALLLAATVALVGLTGCQSARLKQERDALRVESQNLRSTNAELRGRVSTLENENASLREQLAQQPQPAQQPAQANSPFAGISGVETEQSPGRVTVRVPGDVLFASGEASLRDSSNSTLQQIASVINNEYPSETIRVEGYTDTDPIRQSDWADNLELSLHRAAAVERYLIERGVSPDRMYSAGFGESNQRETKAKSRRVEIVVVLNQ